MKTIKIILVLATVFSTLALAAPAQAAGTLGSFSAGKVACGTFPGQHIEIGNPTMYAVNTSGNVDRQWVSYKPVVFKWNGDEWVRYATDGWMQGRATDRRSPTSWFDEGTQEHYAPIAKAINVDAGHYKVAIRYYWHKTKRVGSGSAYRWAPRYDNQDGTVTTNYCTVG